jgi:hypothetical protein
MFPADTDARLQYQPSHVYLRHVSLIPDRYLPTISKILRRYDGYNIPSTNNLGT